MSSDCWVGERLCESKIKLTATRALAIAISILGGQAGSQ